MGNGQADTQEVTQTGESMKCLGWLSGGQGGLPEEGRGPRSRLWEGSQGPWLE